MEERGEDLAMVVEHPQGEGRGLASFALSDEDFPFVTISPLCPDNTAWPLISRRLMDLLDDVISHHEIDGHRLFLTGVSMGGTTSTNRSMRIPAFLTGSWR